MKDIYFMGMIVMYLYSCVEHIMSHENIESETMLDGIKLCFIFLLFSFLWPLALAAFIYEIRNGISKIKS